MTIQSNTEEFKKLAASANTNEKPFVMLNLLKFKDDEGRKSYFEYIRDSAPFVEGVGAKVLYFGQANELLNGTETWDILMLVEYPSRETFLKMANDPGYLKVHEHREAALERAVLYATDPVHFKAILPDQQSSDN
jgi:uncharacterized protein (DUF1330 family)